MKLCPLWWLSETFKVFLDVGPVTSRDLVAAYGAGRPMMTRFFRQVRRASALAGGGSLDRKGSADFFRPSLVEFGKLAKLDSRVGERAGLLGSLAPTRRSDLRFVLSRRLVGSHVDLADGSVVHRGLLITATGRVGRIRSGSGTLSGTR